MRTHLILLLFYLIAFPVFAQQDNPDILKTPWQRFEPLHGQEEKKGKFSPWEFMKKEDEFVTRHAKLTLVEANSVCPLIHKMKDEMRTIDRRIHHLKYQADNPNLDDKASLEIIKKIHSFEKQKIQVEIKYHNKILKELPPGKFLKVLDADSKFDRFMLRNMFMSKFSIDVKRQKESYDNNNK